MTPVSTHSTQNLLSSSPALDGWVHVFRLIYLHYLCSLHIYFSTCRSHTYSAWVLVKMSSLQVLFQMLATLKTDLQCFLSNAFSRSKKTQCNCFWPSLYLSINSLKPANPSVDILIIMKIYCSSLIIIALLTLLQQLFHIPQWDASSALLLDLRWHFYQQSRYSRTTAPVPKLLEGAP